MRWILTLICTLCVRSGLSSKEPAPNTHAPVLVDQNKVSVTSYYGNITENEGNVRLRPSLRAIDHDISGGARFICGYKILTDDASVVPFAIILKSHETGEADIVLEHGVFLDYEVRNVYTFNVSAYDCGSPTKLSNKIPVRISVREFSEPLWQEDAYFAEIEEGQPKGPIIQVQAYERHKTAGNKICSYKVLTPNVPFTVDNNGNIKLKENEKLVYADKHNHILAVTATDCSGRTSKPVMVNFVITPECKIGWEGIPSKIDYYPGSGRKPLAENARFNKCQAPCNEERVTSTIYLSTKGKNTGCDHDASSIKSQRKVCGALADGVNLLPPADLYASWTNDHPKASIDPEHRDEVYSFDGKTNAIKIPDGKIDHSLTEHFSIMLWMKHGQETESNRENILCNADGEEMSRHHYALFIRNCRLVFLLRKEYNKVDFDVFKPAEWRWKIPEVCDGQWHHYAVSVDFPQVRLYVDGRLFMESKSNPVIVDDWPLHKAKKIHFTELVVGACWEGGEQHLSQFFKGHMAGLTVIRGKTESDAVIRCLNNCKEKLDFHALYMMEGGMSISYNSELTQLTVNSRNMTQIGKILAQVGYINYRMFPTIGHRQVKITTDIKCAGSDGPVIKIPDVNLQVDVKDGREPVITLSGGDSLMAYERQLKKGGVKLFGGMTVMETVSKDANQLKQKVAETFVEETLLKGKVFAEKDTEEEEGEKEVTEKKKKEDFSLDSCSVVADTSLSNLEVLTYPANLVTRLRLTAKSNKNGLKIHGPGSLIDYQTLLREVHYINKKPEEMRQRTFSLRCSQNNQRFISNQFKITVTVIHTAPHTGKVHAHAQVSNIQYSASNPGHEVPYRANPDLNMGNKEATHFIGATTNFNAVVITVICVGFLMFMIILGVIRIRDAHNRTQVVQVDEKLDEEMEWDNSALTITVNPMEDDMGPTNFGEFDEKEMSRGELESESDDDSSSYRDDDLETSDEEEEEEEVKKMKRDLEWDDSTLPY